MAKITMTLEDKGSKTVSFLTEIEEVESSQSEASPAMCMSMAVRAMFDNGMLAESAAVALEGMGRGEVPSEVLMAYYSKKEEPK